MNRVQIQDWLINIIELEKFFSDQCVNNLNFLFLFLFFIAFPSPACGRWTVCNSLASKTDAGEKALKVWGAALGELIKSQ